MSADRESVSLAEPSYWGYLTFEEVPESDVFIRRFFVLDRANCRLEYYADSDDWVADSFVHNFICDICYIATYRLRSSKRFHDFSVQITVSKTVL